jgi:hypothetical protein
LDYEQHWACAQAITEEDFPFADKGVHEWDLQFAADITVANIPRLYDERIVRLRPLQALAQRMRPITEALRQHQHPQVRSVTQNMNLGFLAISVVLLSWPAGVCRCAILLASPALARWSLPGY